MCKRIRVYFLTNLSIANLQEMSILLKFFCFLQKIFFNEIAYTILPIYPTMGERKIQTWSLQSS